MSIFGKGCLMAFAYLGGAAVGGSILYRLAPFWVLQVAAVLWFGFFVYRGLAMKCPHCGQSATFGPISHNPFRPRCPNCGTSIFTRMSNRGHR